MEKLAVVSEGAPEQFTPCVFDPNFIIARLISVDPNYDLFGHNRWSMAASIACLIEFYFRFYWRQEQLELPSEAKPHTLVHNVLPFISLSLIHNLPDRIMAGWSRFVTHSYTCYCVSAKVASVGARLYSMQDTSSWPKVSSVIGKSSNGMATTLVWLVGH